MLISVVCTNFNKEPYIEECISSVLAQGYDNYEFIIVDDCSTDGSPDIIQNFARQYPDKIIFLRNEKNSGMAASFNRAIGLAKGSVLSLIDSDDIWFEDKLKEVADFFENCPGCVMHQHPLEIYDFHEPTKEYYRPYLLSGDIIQYAKDTKQIPLFVVTTGLSFRMDAVKKTLPIPVSFSKNGEAFLTRTVICYGDVGTSWKVLGGYRKTDTNLVFGNNNWDSFEFSETVLKPSLNKFYTDHKIDLYYPPHNTVTRPGQRSILRRILGKFKK